MPLGGIIRWDGRPIPAAWLAPWLDAPADRVAFAYRTDNAALFLISDPSSADQLLADDGDPIVLFDGWLDDADETLPGDGTSTSDAARIRTAVRSWRGDAARHLLGDFAIAMWDPARRALVLARDAVGCRSLFYVRHDRALAFATSLTDLLRLPFLDRSLDATVLEDRLRWRPRADPGATLYRHVRAVPAGHRVVCTSEQIAEERDWSFPSARSAASAPDEAYVDRFRGTLIRAVECRMAGARRVAVHLSGGLDSSAITCIAARALAREGRRLTALCSVLPTGHRGVEEDERAYIEAVLAQEANVDVEWIETPAEVDPLGALDRWFEALGRPTFHPITHVEERLGEAGRRAGVDAVLSGFGGDFCASWRGNTVIRTLLVNGNLMIAGRELLAWRRAQRATWAATLRQQLVGPLLPRGGARDGAAGVGRSAPERQMHFVLDPGRVEQSLAAQSQLFSAMFGQRLRFPLLDRRLLAFMFTVPVEQLQRHGETRSLMRRAIAGIVPERVRLRPDKGPAFDPLLAARVAAHRDRIAAWVHATADHTCWQVVDRTALLDGLGRVEPSGRAGWTRTMFVDVLMGVQVARFLQWHARSVAGLRA